MQRPLDDFDKHILRLLQTDSSLSSGDIAARIGLSQPPCWRRIQRLHDEGYIDAQVCCLNRKKLGLKTQIFAQVKLSAAGRSNVAAFGDVIRNFPEVLECYLVLGTTDYMVRIVTRDVEAYERFYLDKLSQAPNVQEINSMVVLSEIKSSTAVPID